MVKKIEKDVARFRQIVKGKIRKELRKYISNGELIGKQGKELVSIPIPQIDIPRFRFGHSQMGGVGQGEGDEGTPIGIAPDAQKGGDKAGNNAENHLREVEYPLCISSMTRNSRNPLCLC